MLSEDFKEFLRLLNDNRVEYLVVGGYAVGFYGYPRYTGDLDIWVRATRENGTRLKKTLDQFGFGSLKLSAEDVAKEYAVIQLGYPPLRIDVVTTLDGVTFDECFRKRNDQTTDGIRVSLIALDDLKRNERSTGRSRDLDDLENLE
jgi:hypothetical protein